MLVIAINQWDWSTINSPFIISDILKIIAFLENIINHVCYLGILVCKFGFIPVSKSLNLLTLFREVWEHLMHGGGWGWVIWPIPTNFRIANDRKLNFYRVVAHSMWFSKLEKKYWLTCLVIQLWRHNYAILAKIGGKQGTVRHRLSHVPILVHWIRQS